MPPQSENGRPLHDRLRLYLASDDGRKLRRLGAVALLIVLRPLLMRLLALATVASVGVVAGSTLSSSPAAEPAPIKRAWLASAAGIKVERIQVPCLTTDVDERRAPKGVAHTTEGGWASAVSVFSRRYAPHFMVGRDQGKVRIVQFCPLGKAASALRNLAGGVETNRWARAQIEIVGYSQRTLWKPDPGVLKAYAALLYELRQAAGIPLRHVPNGSRSAAAWRDRSGWFAHAGVPENDHWDVGQLDWPAALELAARFAPVLNPGHKPVAPAPAARYRVCYWQRGLPKAVCLDVRYASLRPLTPAAATGKPLLAAGSVGVVLKPR